MKVLYDISVLGVGYHSRAGVFRVVENVAYALKNSKECELVFCSSGNSHNLCAVLDYLETNPELAKVDLSHGNFEFQQSLHKIQHQIAPQIKRASGVTKIPIKAISKSLNYANKIIEPFYKSVDAKNLNESNIYHSPFFAVPPQIQSSRHLKRFLTVYDLIPILYPDFFESSKQNIDNVQKALCGLDSESWALCISQSTKDDLCNYSNNVDPAKVFVTYLAASNFSIHVTIVKKLN